MLDAITTGIMVDATPDLPILLDLDAPTDCYKWDE